MHAPKVSQLDLRSSPRRFLRRGFATSARGSALIAALVFTVIIALALAGMGTLTVSHYNLAHVEADSAAALDLAESGVNWELYKLTNQGIANADRPDNTYARNASDYIATGLVGTFTVACTNRDGTRINVNTSRLISITCTARVRGATRAVVVNARPYSTFYTLYTTTGTYFNDNGIVVNGISGTNGSQTIKTGLTSPPHVTSLVFNGSVAPTGPEMAGYTMVSNPQALTMKKTTDYVNEAFPNGGEDYIRTHNDNALAVREDTANPNAPQPPAISTRQDGSQALEAKGHDKITLKGKTGGANYYLADINMEDQSNLVFDNTDGPINIYLLRNSGGGSFMRGGHALRSLQDAPNNQVKLFMSAAGGINIDAADPIPGVPESNVIDLGIYNYDTYVVNTRRGPVTVQTGFVNIGTNVDFEGQIVADTINMAASASVIGHRGYFETPTEYYGFDGGWRELNGAGSVGGANQ